MLDYILNSQILSHMNSGYSFSKKQFLGTDGDLSIQRTLGKIVQCCGSSPSGMKINPAPSSNAKQ